VDPHSTEIISQKIVEGVAGQEAQAVRDPVRLIGVVVIVGLGLLAQFANSVGSLFISTGPYFEGDAVESVRGILLENKRVMDAMRLRFAGADFDIVRETGLI
jgi:hydroxymethylglutaryl-CoA reductase